MEHPLFKNKSFPAMSPQKAWQASLRGFQAGNDMVVFKAELLYDPAKAKGKAFQLKLRPLATQLGHRLDRRFGSDRFIELVIPTLDTYERDDQSKILPWLCLGHAFLGRSWRPFFTKRDKKNVRQRKGEEHNEKSGRQVFFETVYLFATDGNNFRSPGETYHPSRSSTQVPPLEACGVTRTRSNIRGLLDWTLSLSDPRNTVQAAPKLFSRLALSLSRSYPAVTLLKRQIINEPNNIISSSEMVMNDGVGTMSRSLAQAVAERLGLEDTPSAFQGRLGSAKGVWIIDVTEDGSTDKLWIKTFPSQRKWECPFEDPEHRTFEIKSWPRSVKPAGLNLQFIPVLENQAGNRQQMRDTIAQRLEFSLRQDMDAEKEALNDPLQLRQLVSRTGKTETGKQSGIAFKGGLPSTDEDRAALLLDSGFTIENRFLSDILWKLRQEKILRLRQRMKIRIPCSTYVLIVADFWGFLEPGEVHLSFSNKFRAEGSKSVPSFSDTLVEDTDVLVGRSPAHFPSDIQKVKAISHPKLRKLKDVIVFSTKGLRPLADRLSGGDYDGDQAWVCWDPCIVNNFVNAEDEDKGTKPDFVAHGYLKKQRDTFQDFLLREQRTDTAYDKFIYNGLSFNMQTDMLGICTKFKERLCYYQPLGIADPAVLTLDALLSDLVDQAKGGIELSFDQWKRFKTQCLQVQTMLEPAEYENEKPSDKWSRAVRSGRRKSHILDFLKFHIADGIIEAALEEFSQALKPKDKTPQPYDADLTSLHHEFDRWARPYELGGSKSGTRLLKDLKEKLCRLKKAWDAGVASETPLDDLIMTVHQDFMGIQPLSGLKSSRTINCLNDAWMRCSSTENRPQLETPGELDWSSTLSRWSLLKASTLFTQLYKTNEWMCWQIAGRQLLHIKASVVSSRSDTPILVTPEMYAILQPDKKTVKRLVAAKQAAAGESDSLAALDEVNDFDEEGTVIDDA